MFKKIIAGTAAAAVLVGVSACSAPADGGSSAAPEEVTFFSTAGWEDMDGVTYLWQNLLAEKGITMNIEALDLAAGFAGMAAGDIDGNMDTWLPNGHGEMIAKYPDEIVQLDPEGYYHNDAFVIAVPNYSPASSIPELITNAADFNNQIIGIEAGSGLMAATPKMLAAYPGGDKLTVVEGSYAAMMASLEAALTKKENIAVTLWTPMWAFAKMDIKALEDPEQGYGAPDSSVITVVKNFEADHPQIASWMKNMQLDDDQFASLMLAVNQADGDAAKGVKEWLKDTDNNELAHSWLK